VIAPGQLTDAATLAIEHGPVPAEQVIEGSPTTGIAELTDGIGVWEITPGTVRDTEIDEVFVVLSGRATLEFHDPALPSIELSPGSTVLLTAGMQTVWIVHETLRKVYIG
jgi:uncharacterized protein